MLQRDRQIPGLGLIWRSGPGRGREKEFSMEEAQGASYDFANILFSGPCNLRCPYCIGKQVDPRLNVNNLAAFPLRNLERFVEWINRYQVSNVVLTGTNTDPQLYSHEGRLIQWLRGHTRPTVRLSLHTNGQLALHKIDLLNQYDKVSISLPSFRPGTYEKMTGSCRVPDLAAIVRQSRVSVKVSCVIDEHNADEIPEFLVRCRDAGIQRVVLRRLFGEMREWHILADHQPASFFRRNPVYDVLGMQVTYWRFERTTSTSINLFSDGTISTSYLLTEARPTAARAA
jgi:molybdenum cofactor biosynthesis enzyme MoaA